MAGLVLLDAFAAAAGTLPSAFRIAVAAAVLGVGVPVFFWVVTRIDRVFSAFDRLRGFVVMLQTDHVEGFPRGLGGSLPAEAGAMLDAVDALLRARLERRNRPSDQLEAVMRSIPEALIVVNAAGQVGLVNAAARNLLGEAALELGTSVFDAITRTALESAMQDAERTGAPVDTVVRTVDGRALAARLALIEAGQGAVLLFRESDVSADRELRHDLGLLAEPPPPIPVDASTPLTELPICVVDLETTGLDVERDAIVSVGGVRMVGATIFRGRTVDRLINPDRPIPPRSSVIHGITDELVADAPRFARIWPELTPFLNGTVLVGHNIGFDIAHLLRSTREAGIPWQAPRYLCTYLLAAGMELQLHGLKLETLAAAFGLTVRGRHTALGDSLVTADLFARLLPMLADRGVRTLGDAEAFLRRRQDLLRMQRQAGWWTGGDD